MSDLYGTAYPNPNLPQKTIDEKGARLRTQHSSYTTLVAVTAAAERILLAKVPSMGRPVDLGKLRHTAFSAGTGTLGLYHEKMTSAEATAAKNCLINVATLLLTSAGSYTWMQTAAATVTNLGKKFWELAGMTEDPGGEFDVVLTVAVATSATGTIDLEATFVRD